MPFATPEDVQKRLGRDLTESETVQATEWIADLEADIRARIPDVDDLMNDPVSGTSYTRTVLRVVCETIIVKLKNPKGLRQSTRSGDDISITETVDSANSSGRLMITDDDWALLMPAASGDAFTIRLGGSPGFADEAWL